MNNIEIRFSGLTVFLTIFFIMLKFFGLITWTWLWVLAPIWLPFVIILIVVFILIFKDFFNMIKNN